MDVILRTRVKPVNGEMSKDETVYESVESIKDLQSILSSVSRLKSSVFDSLTYGDDGSKDLIVFSVIIRY